MVKDLWLITPFPGSLILQTNVFSADHGRHLGEHNAYGKHALFELATQVPLLIHVPGLTDDGMLRHQLVELVDLFPTLVELTGSDYYISDGTLTLAPYYEFC